MKDAAVAQTDISTVALSRAELIYAIRHDCVSFFSFYLAEELTLKVPDFHEEIWTELLEKLEEANQPAVQRSLRKLFAVPREHSKSTIAKLAVILFAKFSPFSFVLYVSKTNANAKNAIRDILIWLGTPQESGLYGPMTTLKSSENESLWIVDLKVRYNAIDPPRVKRVIFKALGADQQVRGLLILNKRPEIIIVDDIEDLDNTTQDQQPKLDEWFMGSLRKSFARSHFIMFIGNMIRKTTLLARLSKEALWNPTVFGCLVRDLDSGNLRPLWEGRWTVEALLTDYREYRRLGQGHIWEAEMMNLTQDDLFGQDMNSAVRPPQPLAEDLEAGFIVLDPAYGMNNWNDDSAITIHARVKGLAMPCVIDSWKGKATEDQLFDKLLDFSYKWGLTTWCIESVAAQKLFVSYFTLLFQTRGMNPDAFMIVPVSSGQINKGSRILAFRRSASSGSYAIAESEQDLIDRLALYSPESKDHDDLCDSAAYGVNVWALYHETILVRGIQQIGLIAYGDGTDTGKYVVGVDACPF